LTYPEIFLDAAQGRAVQHKRICRTFSDCTTGSAEWIAFGLLSAGWSLQDVPDGREIECAEGKALRVGYEKPPRHGRRPLRCMFLNCERHEIDALMRSGNCGGRLRGLRRRFWPFEADGSVALRRFSGIWWRLTGWVDERCEYGYGVCELFERCGEVRRVAVDARGVGPGVAFVAGAYIEGQRGDVVALYRREMERIVEFGGVPILFQTARLHGKSQRRRLRVPHDLPGISAGAGV